MRRSGLGLMLVALALVLPAAASSAAPVAALHSGIAGTLLNSTSPICPPPCRVNIPCAPKRMIVCPQPQRTATICLATGCGFEYPPYEGEGATVTVRRAGSAQVIRTVTPVQGQFSIPLGAGRYVLRGHVALPCWSGEKVLITVQPGRWTAGAQVLVHDGCVVHPTAAG